MSQETNFVEDAVVDNDYSPLDAPVKQRAYTQHHIADAQVVDDLEEPTFVPPSVSDFDDDGEAVNEPQRPFNESFNELPKKDKAMGAEMATDVVLDLYSKGCGLLGKLAEIPEAKLDRLIAEGEIDPNIQIPVEGGEVGVKDFAREFNSGTKEAFEVSSEFKEQVRRVMIRVFEKRGVGMTDEQTLAYLFGTDLLSKGASAFMLRKTVNGVLDSLQESTKLMREQIVNQPKPSPIPDVKSSVVQEEYSEKISDVVSEKPVRKNTRTKPKTNLEEQVEFFEPEEAGSVFSNLKDEGGFKHETKTANNMPTFGDPEILNGINNIAKQADKPVRRVKKQPVKKPRNRKS